MEIPLLDAIDLEIIMHRNVHFGGSFEVMIEYYQNEGIGVMPDFELDRIEALDKLEGSIDENLSEKVLPLPAQQEVARSKELYVKLRDVYQEDHEIPTLISDLILSETEGAEKEINALVAKGPDVVKPLLQMIQSSDFYNPLNPGFGLTPITAAIALARIGDKSAVPVIFGAIGQEFTTDEAFISALVTLSAHSKDFLLKQLQHLPFSKDNDHAAIVLSSFPLDGEIALVALSLLTQPETLKQPSLSSYLICCCEGLKTSEERQQFIDLSKSDLVPKELQAEFQIICNSWVSR